MELNAMKMTKTGQLSAAKQRELATRVNPITTGYAIKDTSDRARKEVKGKSEYTPRIRDAAEAMPITYNIWSGGIYDGAELRPFTGRPGAMDFLKCPSKGIG